MKVRTIENPIIKDKVTFIRTSDETNGEVSEIVVDLAPGGGNEPHYHTSFVESFSQRFGESHFRRPSRSGPIRNPISDRAETGRLSVQTLRYRSAAMPSASATSRSFP